jgi:hypothetical protein
LKNSLKIKTVLEMKRDTGKPTQEDFDAVPASVKRLLRARV